MFVAFAVNLIFFCSAPLHAKGSDRKSIKIIAVHVCQGRGNHFYFGHLRPFPALTLLTLHVVSGRQSELKLVILRKQKMVCRMSTLLFSIQLKQMAPGPALNYIEFTFVVYFKY